MACESVLLGSLQGRQHDADHGSLSWPSLCNVTWVSDFTFLSCCLPTASKEKRCFLLCVHVRVCSYAFTCMCVHMGKG